MANLESNRMEYKRELDKGDKLEKAVVSFLNYNGGGEILIGVADDGTVCGVADPDGDQRKIADRLANNIRPKVLGLFDVVAEKMDGKYNFLAYLLADNNGASIKVAKYAGTDKIDLIENEEYGYQCLITAIYRVLDKFAVENKTFAKITPRNRLERKLINPVALREAFINAVVHNDYNLGWPVVEFFSDRVTLTSTGGLVTGLSKEDFFNGRTMLRNRELMRIFKDVELVESLGSGMRRILDAYGRSVFEIRPSFIIVTFPYAEDFERSASEDGDKPAIIGDKPAISSGDRKQAIIDYLRSSGEVRNAEIAKLLGLRPSRTRDILSAMVEEGIVEKVGDKKSTTYKLSLK